MKRLLIHEGKVLTPRILEQGEIYLVTDVLDYVEQLEAMVLRIANVLDAPDTIRKDAKKLLLSEDSE